MQAMTLRLPDDVHEALRREAYESRRSMNALILEALASVAQMKRDLDQWEAEGAPRWVESKHRQIKEAAARAWDEGLVAGAEWGFLDGHAHKNGGDAVPRPANPYWDGSK